MKYANYVFLLLVHLSFTYSSDLQPPVGSREKEVGCVVGVGQLQHPLLEASLVSLRNTNRHVRHRTATAEH